MDDGLVLSWKNVSLYINVEKKKIWGQKEVQRIKLLNRVSGLVKSGTICAVMGPSGAGKTSLLAALGQRYTGNLMGGIHMNGHPVDRNLMSKMSGFVPQQDLAIQSLKVHEHLHFMASLKLDRRVSPLQKNRIISSLMQELGLTSCSFVRLSALSGGERKRVCLAVQLVTDPPVLICDEPTTGLDSYTASSVVCLLKQLASRGKAIIASVHQPASGIFELFDTVSLLVPGGRQAYFGDVNGAKKYFESMGLSCPPSYNCAEFITTQLNTLPDKLSDIFLTSHHFIQMHKDIEAANKTSINNQLIYGMEEKFLKFYSVQPPTQKSQLKWLMWRTLLDLCRNSQKVLLRLVMYILTGLLIATPYVGVEFNQEGIQNLQGLNYSVITETVFTQSYAVMNTFPAEIPILLREMDNGVYRPGPYYLSKVLLMIPKTILETLLFCFVIYFVVGLSNNSSSFAMFAVPVIVSAIASSAYGCCISAMFENISAASLLSVPVDFVSYTYSGIFLQLSTVPIYLSWIKYISRFYYGLEALSILQWSHVDNIACSPNPELPCISSGAEVLEYYGYHSNNLFLDLLGLTLMFIILHCIGFYFFEKRSRKESSY